MLQVILLTLCLAVPPQAPVVVEPRKAPPVAECLSPYELALVRVLAGETVIVDSIPGQPRGKYRCFLRDGKAVYEPVTIEAAPKAAVIRIAGPAWDWQGVPSGMTSTATMRAHLMAEHGYTAAQLAGLTREDLIAIHDNAHNRKPARPKISFEPPCPGNT